MVVRKRKKVVKYRGSSTHGGGARKKRRGAGSRGGRGNAGTGKRAGQKKAGMDYKLGRHGFTSKSVTAPAINLGYFQPKVVEKLVEQGSIVKEGEFYVLDLARLGYSKIFSGGKSALKLKVINGKVSPAARKKILAAGGKVEVEEASSAEE